MHHFLDVSTIAARSCRHCSSGTAVCCAHTQSSQPGSASSIPAPSCRLIYRSRKLPLSFGGLFEVYDAVAILGLWRHDIGNYLGRSLLSMLTVQCLLSSVLQNTLPADSYVVPFWIWPVFLLGVIVDHYPKGSRYHPMGSTNRGSHFGVLIWRIQPFWVHIGCPNCWKLPRGVRYRRLIQLTLQEPQSQEQVVSPPLPADPTRSCFYTLQLLPAARRTNKTWPVADDQVDLSKQHARLCALKCMQLQCNPIEISCQACNFYHRSRDHDLSWSQRRDARTLRLSLWAYLRREQGFRGDDAQIPWTSVQDGCRSGTTLLMLQNLHHPVCTILPWFLDRFLTHEVMRDLCPLQYQRLWLLLPGSPVLRLVVRYVAEFLAGYSPGSTRALAQETQILRSAQTGQKNRLSLSSNMVLEFTWTSKVSNIFGSIPKQRFFGVYGPWCWLLWWFCGSAVASDSVQTGRSGLAVRSFALFASRV